MVDGKAKRSTWETSEDSSCELNYPSLRRKRERLGHPPYAVFGDPQSLNLYNYVRNDPISRIDPDGHYEVNASGRVAQPFALFAKAGVVHSAGGPAFRIFC